MGAFMSNNPRSRARVTPETEARRREEEELEKLAQEERKRRARVMAEASSRRSFIQNAADGGGFISPAKMMGR